MIPVMRSDKSPQYKVLQYLSLSGFVRLSSLLTFCWNFLISNTRKGFSMSTRPWGSFITSLLTALSSGGFLTNTWLLLSLFSKMLPLSSIFTLAPWPISSLNSSVLGSRMGFENPFRPNLDQEVADELISNFKPISTCIHQIPRFLHL